MHRDCSTARLPVSSPLAWLLLICATTAVRAESPPADLVLVQGAGGQDDYQAAFGQWAQSWIEAGEAASMAVHRIGLDKVERSDRELLQQTLQQLAADTQRPLWLVLIGHGTFFQDQAKFNLTGPDVSASELAEWLRPLQRPVAIVNCASCSGPFIDRLSGSGRVVITATRSGAEQYYTRFGQFLAAALRQPTADIDHDGAVSLLEAFLTAARKTQAFYDDDARLATEHAVLDDNGDRTGTPAEFFRGIRVQAQAATNQSVDGLRAHQWMLSQLTDQPPLSAERQAERNCLETEIERLRQRKSTQSEDEYYEQLEAYLVQLARLYEPQN
jgi:hypothetical protein